MKRYWQMTMVVVVAMAASTALAGDCPQWGADSGHNMVSAEKNLPDSFVPGEKDSQDGSIDMKTTKNVKWAVRLGNITYATPVVAGGKVYMGYGDGPLGVLLCVDEQTGKPLWRWAQPHRKDCPATIDGRKFNFATFPPRMGVCSTPTVEGDRLYFVNQRLEAVCLDTAGRANAKGSEPADAKVIWSTDIYQMGVRPSDACNSSVLIDGPFLYICTSNGVDRLVERKDDALGKPPAPDAPLMVVLEKSTGRLLATDDANTGPRLMHGQWSSPTLGTVGGKKLVILGGGDGVCYAFEALTTIPEKPVKLKTAWSCDCNPPEYKNFGGLDRIDHYARGDRRRRDTLNKVQDGTWTGMSEIIATPVFVKDRVYVSIGRDPAHGRARGALWCIDATKTGDVTRSGKIWCYQGIDRSISTVAVADGLVYASDVAGRLHCLDDATGKVCWIFEGRAETMGSPLLADGKVYQPTEKHLNILSAGRELKELSHIRLGAPMWSSPVAANGVLYISSTRYLWAVKKMEEK